MARTRDEPRRPPNYFSRREQWRLLLLVFSLGLVLVLMQQARRPASWRWLWGAGRRGLSGSPLADGNRPRESLAERPLVAKSGTLPRSISRFPPAENSGQEDGQFLPGVEPGILASIKDDTVFRLAERDAWFGLFAVLQDRSEEELASDSIGDVGFVQLFRQPDRYRGRLVTVRGQARRALFRTAPDNDAEVRGYWQLVLKPAGGPDSPLIVYCLGLPRGFPTGEGIQADVAIHGFFFKNWAFTTGQEIHSFPTLLARNVVWSPPVPVANRPVTWSHFVAMLSGTAIAGVLLALWVHHRSGQITAQGRSASRPVRSGAAAGPVSEDASCHVEDALRRLAQKGP